MPSESTGLAPELEIVARFAAIHLADAFHRSPAAEVQLLLANRFGLNRGEVRAVIRHLLGAGELVYTYEHGCSFLEPSYRKPIRVAKRVVLVPADLPYQPAGEEVAVRIAPGASFGNGRHPSTRLAIQGIEQALEDVSPAGGLQRSAVLDVGTGSGVLVIAAVKLGFGRGVGVDTDPCARWETHQNVSLNRLAAKIEVLDRPLERIKPTGRFYLIVANLRTPTLLCLAPTICDLSAPLGRLVLSGIRAEEMNVALKRYRDHRCRELWVAEEKGWAAVVLQSPTV